MIPRVVQEFVAQQLGISASLYQKYDWQGRASHYHRAEIRQLLQFRPVQSSDFDELRQWLIDVVLPKEVDARRIQQLLLEELKNRKTSGRLTRLLTSAKHQFETQLCAAISERIAESCRKLCSRTCVTVRTYASPPAVVHCCYGWGATHPIHKRVFEKSVSQVKKQKSSLSIKLPIV